MKKAILVLAILLVAAMALFVPTGCAACDNGYELAIVDANENELDEPTKPLEEVEYTPERLPDLPAYFYTTANLHLRQTASIQASSLELVPIGTRVQVLYYLSDTWFRVQHSNQVGYMSTEFLSETMRVNIASLWGADRDTMRRVLGEPARSQRWAHSNASNTYTFSYGASVCTNDQLNGTGDFSIVEIFIRYQQANLQRFHFRGIDGTSTRNDVVAAFGQPERISPDGAYLFPFGDDWSVEAAIHFDRNERVNVIRLYTTI